MRLVDVKVEAVDLASAANGAVDAVVPIAVQVNVLLLDVLVAASVR